MDDLRAHPAIAAFWRKFMNQYPGTDAEERFLEHFQFGTHAASANELAQLVVAGTKTATSSLVWEYEGIWESYARICAPLGRQPSEEMPLICERFRVVYAPAMR